MTILESALRVLWELGERGVREVVAKLVDCSIVRREMFRQSEPADNGHNSTAYGCTI